MRLDQSIPRVYQLTPAGRGAVATVAVVGKNAAELAVPFFRAASNRPLNEIAIDRIAFGRFGRFQGEDELSEEVVVCRRSNERVEIHGHGGRAAVERIVELLVSAGCERGEWTSLVAVEEENEFAAEARIALADAATPRTAAILLDQYRGALRREFDRINALSTSGDKEAAQRSIDDLLARRRAGEHLTTPFRLVLAGPPNVGKSSLINAMLGYERSIVFDRPGTTRDVLTAAGAIDGWPVEFVDTAGLCESFDEIESAGVAAARAAAASADVTVLVFDGSAGWSTDEQLLFDSVPADLVVFNKCDLGKDEDRSRPAGHNTSALTGEGVEELITRLGQAMVSEPPGPGDAVPFLPRHFEMLAGKRG